MTVFLSNQYRLPAVCGFMAAIVLSLVSLVSCGGNRSSSSGPEGKRMDMRHARLLTMTEHEGYTEAVVRNPWDTTKTLQRYLLVPKEGPLPPGLPKGTVVRTPVENILVYSTVHSRLIGELGRGDAIGGMCDVEFIKDSTLKRRLGEGTLTACGLSQNPNIEKIVSLKPELIMLSPYEHGEQNAKIDALGIPLLQCTDYMESSPLGRAEWMRFYGKLLGAEDKSEKLFSDIEAQYLALKSRTAAAGKRPEVIIDQRYGQVWHVPCGNSTTGRLIEDAGGHNPFVDYDRSGSVALAPERVLADAHDADIWLVRYNQANEKTLAELALDAPVNSRFKAFKEGNVYGCNTRYVDLFEEVAFHPELLLRDMSIIFHPEIFEGETPVFYGKMK